LTSTLPADRLIEQLAMQGTAIKSTELLFNGIKHAILGFSFQVKDTTFGCGQGTVFSSFPVIAATTSST